MPTRKKPKTLDDIVKGNIAKIADIDEAANLKRPLSAQVADKIANFCGSMAFVWVHLVVFGTWLVVNLCPIFPRWMQFDPAPLHILTLLTPIEAIFLSTFILISQNRQEEIANDRNHLELQINLLSEQENSEILRLLMQIREKIGVAEVPSDAQAFSQPIDPTQLAGHIKDHKDSLESS